MEISVTNTNMDLYCSKLYLYEGYLNQLYEKQMSLVECVNRTKDELFQLNMNIEKNELSQLKSIKESDALLCSCNEEVEINDKLLESIERFKKLFTYELIGDYLLFSYDQPMWLNSLDLSRGRYYAKGIGKLSDFYKTRSCNPNVLELDIFVPFNKVFTHLFCRGDSHVGPYRIKKQDMLEFGDFVYNVSQCANGRLYSIIEALQIVHLQKPYLGVTASNKPGQFVTLDE